VLNIILAILGIVLGAGVIAFVGAIGWFLYQMYFLDQ
jgi:hypothetical protein